MLFLLSNKLGKVFMENDIIVSLIKNGGIVSGLTIVYFIIKLFANGRVRKNGNETHSNVSHSIAYTDKVKDTMTKVEDLHTWHKPDSKGTQEWKNPNLAEAIDKLTKSITDMTKQSFKIAHDHSEAHRGIMTLVQKGLEK